MLTALQRSGGIDALARQAGIEVSKANSFAKAALPAILVAMRNVTGGRQGLLAAFELQGGAGLAATVMAVERADPAPGQAILANTFGEAGNDLGDVAKRAGMPEPERVLPLLVMLVAGYVSAMAAGHGAGPQGLDDLLG